MFGGSRVYLWFALSAIPSLSNFLGVHWCCVHRCGGVRVWAPPLSRAFDCRDVAVVAHSGLPASEPAAGARRRLRLVLLRAMTRRVVHMHDKRDT